MQENPMRAAMQPFLKFAQSNMDLMMKFSMSPGQASATTLYGASAFAELMQGMLKNYTEFMTEFAQSGMAVLAQGRAAMARQAEEFGANVLDAEEARGRRNKKAADPQAATR